MADCPSGCLEFIVRRMPAIARMLHVQANRRGPSRCRIGIRHPALEVTHHASSTQGDIGAARRVARGACARRSIVCPPNSATAAGLRSLVCCRHPRTPRACGRAIHRDLGSKIADARSRGSSDRSRTIRRCCRRTSRRCSPIAPSGGRRPRPCIRAVSGATRRGRERKRRERRFSRIITAADGLALSRVIHEHPAVRRAQRLSMGRISGRARITPCASRSGISRRSSIAIRREPRLTRDDERRTARRVRRTSTSISSTSCSRAVRPRRRVLDAGCGDGRNLHYLLRAGFDCFGIDEDAAAVDQVRRRAAQLAPRLPPSHFASAISPRSRGTPRAWTPSSAARCCISRTTRAFRADAAGVVARARARRAVLRAPRVQYRPRDASSVTARRTDAPARRQRRFVVDEPMLLEWTDRLGARLIDPIKTTNVQQQRCMTTWCLAKANGHENIRAAR